VDPVLNKGVALEGLGRFRDALACYEAVLDADPAEPAAWNNLGNAKLALGDWKGAQRGYEQATRLAPQFAFSQCNLAIAVFQGGEDDARAKRLLRGLTRKYPDFNDAHAALVALYWDAGAGEQAEDEWVRVEDPRYKDVRWLQEERRWPPRAVKAMKGFLGPA